MDKNFDQAFNLLNQHQKEAVETIDGPLLVIAGPGTGKTQILSLRAANILKRTDTDPASILCLTFTNLAATNMRERLVSLIGPTGSLITVRTFHGFAAEIMNLYPEYFWNGARLSIVPDSLQLSIIEEVLTGLPIDNPLASKFAGNFTAINDVQSALKLTKEAGLTPSKLKAMINVNEAYIDVVESQIADIFAKPLSIKKLEELRSKLDELPDQDIGADIMPLKSLSQVIKQSFEAATEKDLASGKTTQTGIWKRRWLQNVDGQRIMSDERRRNKWWLALADVYTLYRDKLHTSGYYDYSDMIIEVNTQLEQKPELLASVRERYLYTLIDEFQDTNAAQLRLAHLVSTQTGSDSPNIMAVGDDDQSIFGFNGAELNNMLSFQQAYPETKTIVLTDNYRSHQEVLDQAGQIISQASDRLVQRLPNLSKDLKAVSAASKGRVMVFSYPTREHQLMDIAQKIKQDWENNNGQSLAVLARSHESLRKLSGQLAKLNVPISYERQNNVLEIEFIEQLVLLADLVLSMNQGDKPSVNYFLSNLLTHPAWGISSKQLWDLAATNYRGGDWLSALQTSEDKNLQAIATWLTFLSQETGYQNLSIMLEYLLGLRPTEFYTSPLYSYFINTPGVDSNKLQALSGLQTLTNLVAEVSSVNQKAMLKDLVKVVTLSIRLERPITDESWFVSGNNNVQLLTIHKSKGLEFDQVYILDAVENNWRPRHIGRKPPANLPLQPYGEQLDDYVRLAYVAATRAKSSLIISTFEQDASGQKTLTTPLFESFALEKVEPTEEGSIEAITTNLSWPQINSSDAFNLLKPRLSNYKLSATGLLNFLDISRGGPEHFLANDLLRLPQLTTPNMAFGTAMHNALQTAQLLINSSGFKLEAVCNSYENNLKNQTMEAKDYERYLEYGKTTLTRLFEDKLLTLPTNGQAELSIDDLLVNEVRLTGKLDHVYESDDDILITDYKTGKALSSFSTKDQNKAVKAWRHQTQLLFYCYMYGRSANYKATGKPIHAQMAYLEAESPKQMFLKLQPDPVDIDRLEKIIQAVWQKIINFDLPDTSQYSLDIDGIKSFEEDLIK